MSVSHMDRWHLREDGCLEMEFRDGSGMKLCSSPIIGIDDMNVVWTRSGGGYVIGHPLFADWWPGSAPADVVDNALYLAIRCFQHRDLDGKHLWEMFQDELHSQFAEYEKGR